MSDQKQITHVGSDQEFPLSLLRSLYIIQPSQPRTYPQVSKNKDRKRVLVTGGAGFVGSHLVDRLMLMGHDVIVVDNFFTGSKRNIDHWMGHPNFELIRHDVIRTTLYIHTDTL
jgi:UDP-glucuronate decarboxylase